MSACTDPRHEAFALAYVTNGYNRAIAAREAGMSPGNAHYLLKTPHVAGRIQELIRDHFLPAQITAERTMLELGRIAFGDIRDLFDADGNLLPIGELDADAAARISAVDVEVSWQGKGEDAVPVTVKKIRTYDKMAALGILAKHFKLVGDEGDGVNALAAALAERLRQGRKHRQAAVQDADVVDVEPVTAPPVLPAIEPAEEPLW